MGCVGKLRVESLSGTGTMKPRISRITRIRVGTKVPGRLIADNQ
jgi:hypothetical protein